MAPKAALSVPMAKAAKSGDVTRAPAAEDPVARRLASGKGLPAYISDRDEAVAAAPVAVADLAPTAPLPLPRTARPTRMVPEQVSDDQQPLILDEAAVLANEAEQVRLSDRPARRDTQSLADYLERQGLVSESGTGGSYDPDGFYLDEGPNAAAVRKIRRFADWFLF